MSGFPYMNRNGRYYFEDKNHYIDKASNGGTEDLIIVSAKIPSGVFMSNIARQVVTVEFPHEAEVTVSGQEKLWYNDSGITWTVYRIDVQADYLGGSSGSIVVKINTDGVGGSTDSILTTLDYNAYRTSNTASTLNISNGSVLYIFNSTANGGHEDVEIKIYLRAC